MYRSEPQFGARVRVYNESMMATLLDPEPDESYAPSPERDGAPSPSRTTDRDEELATLASMRRERANQKKKELQDLEEQRKRRYDRNRTEARGKAVDILKERRKLEDQRLAMGTTASFTPVKSSGSFMLSRPLSPPEPRPRLRPAAAGSRDIDRDCRTLWTPFFRMRAPLY